MEKVKDEEENKEAYNAMDRLKRVTIFGIQELLDSILKKTRIRKT